MVYYGILFSFINYMIFIHVTENEKIYRNAKRAEWAHDA